MLRKNHKKLLNNLFTYLMSVQIRMRSNKRQYPPIHQVESRHLLPVDVLEQRPELLQCLDRDLVRWCGAFYHEPRGGELLTGYPHHGDRARLREY